MKFRKLFNGKGLFSFSISELRGFLVLFMILGVVIFLRYRQLQGVGEMVMHSSALPALLPEQDNSEYPSKDSRQPRQEKRKQRMLQHVDPNTADFETLRDAGMSALAAGNLIKYRNKGGRIRKAEDLRRIYGMDQDAYDSISGNFQFKKQGQGLFEANSSKQVVVEINSADTATLRSLPGIGEVLATRIIRYRELLGGFYTVQQLSEVYGLTDSLVSALIPRLRTDTVLIRKIDLNQAGFAEFKKHPYLNAFLARSILDYRKYQENSIDANQLKNNYIIENKIFEKIQPYLE